MQAVLGESSRAPILGRVMYSSEFGLCGSGRSRIISLLRKRCQMSHVGRVDGHWRSGKSFVCGCSVGSFVCGCLVGSFRMNVHAKSCGTGRPCQGAYVGSRKISRACHGMIGHLGRTS